MTVPGSRSELVAEGFLMCFAELEDDDGGVWAKVFARRAGTERAAQIRKDKKCREARNIMRNIMLSCYWNRAMDAEGGAARHVAACRG